MKISVIIALLITIPLLVWHTSHAQSLVAPSDIAFDFKGQVLAASDADMIATAYADGIVNRVDGIQDSLTLLSFREGVANITSKQFVSNSVISWPSIIAWHREKKLAYVAETRGVFESTEQQVKDVWKDFPEGTLISVIDYSDASNPVVIQKVAIGQNIQGVSLNSKGDLLVAGSTEKGKELIIVRLKDGLLEDSFYFTNTEIEKEATNNSGIRTIEFHPNENIIAANLNNDRLVFYHVINDSTNVDIEQIGSSLEVAKRWSVGNWHPSGKYFVLTDVAWGDGTMGAIFNGKGSLVSVTFNEDGDHKIVSKAKVGLSPEGFDLSPDGKYAVVANMRRTYGPKKFWFVPARKNSSLSLVKIDPATGTLETLGKEYGFAGALPEDAIFDSESNSIAVAVYHKQDEPFPTQGWVDFWELKNEQLVYTGQQIKVTRGVHNLLLID